MKLYVVHLIGTDIRHVANLWLASTVLYTTVPVVAFTQQSDHLSALTDDVLLVSTYIKASVTLPFRLISDQLPLDALRFRAGEFCDLLSQRYACSEDLIWI
jgi:hypothetical protein